MDDHDEGCRDDGRSTYAILFCVGCLAWPALILLAYGLGAF